MRVETERRGLKRRSGGDKRSEGEDRRREEE